jgi:hypothetical protein
MPPRVVATAACLACLAAASTVARAGDVVITLEVPKGSPEAPVVTSGFVPRKANPIKPIRRYDPRPYCAVFLEPVEGTEVPAGDQGAILGGVKVQLLVDALTEPTVAVSAGTEVDIQNMSNTARSPKLYSPQDPALVKDDSINPGAVRTIKPAKPLTAYELRSRDTGHLVGRLIAFPSRYAAAQRGGKFTIKDVAGGKYKVRVWFGDGFVKLDEPVVEVGKRGDVNKAITLPAGLAPAPAGGAR